MCFALHRQFSSYVTCHFAIPIFLFVSSCVSSVHVFSSFPFYFSWFSLIPQHTVTQNKNSKPTLAYRLCETGSANDFMLIGVKNVKIIHNMSMHNEIHISYNRTEIVPCFFWYVRRECLEVFPHIYKMQVKF